MANKIISLGTEMLSSGSIEGGVLILLRKAFDFAQENMMNSISFNKFMEEYSSILKNPIEKEQVQEISRKIKKNIIVDVKNCDINTVSTAIQGIVTELEALEVPEERRQNLLDMFICYVMNYIHIKDTHLYNEIVIQSENENNALSIHKLMTEIERIWQTLSALRKADTSVKSGAERLALGNFAELDIRESEINKLKEILDKNTLVFLHGRPGIGKSTLAKLYANASGATQIYFLTFRHSLKNTIQQIGTNPKKTSAKKVLDELKTLQHAGERLLLIIDNFDEDSFPEGEQNNLEEELNSQFYKDLTNSGIPTIITTRALLCANSYEVGAVQDAYALFCKNCERDIREDEERIIKDIIKALHENTMLLVLVAHIWNRINNPEDLLERLRAGEVIEDTISTDVDEHIGYAREGMTIFRQAETIINISGILSHEEMCNVMVHMSLLPLEGMDKREFLSLVGESCENSFERLRKNCWIINDGGNACLHPVIRRVVLKSGAVTYEACRNFCAGIYEKIKIDIPLQDRLKFANCAYEIFRCSKRWEEIDITLVRIFYALSDVYDELAERRISRLLTDVVQKNMNVVDDKIEYARMLSGIAYGINNNFSDEKELDEAFRLLQEAGAALDSVQGEDYKTLSYIRARGQTLSNLGSNKLAYSKCSERLKHKYLEEAVAYHTRAFEYRERMLDASYVTNDMLPVIKKDLATSYTTLATDYFYMEKYEHAISYHEKSEALRTELGNENGVCINRQRIIGCVIEMYKENLCIDAKYIEKILSYYPDLVKSNYKIQAMSSLKTNMQYFRDLYTIVSNDRRLEKYIGTIALLKQNICEWCGTDEIIKKIYEDIFKGE